MAIPETEYMTRTDVAEMLQVSEGTIKGWQKAGFPHLVLGHKIVRYIKEDVLAWISTHAVSPEVAE